MVGDKVPRVIEITCALAVLSNFGQKSSTDSEEEEREKWGEEQTHQNGWIDDDGTLACTYTHTKIRDPKNNNSKHRCS